MSSRYQDRFDSFLPHWKSQLPDIPTQKSLTLEAPRPMTRKEECVDIDLLLSNSAFSKSLWSYESPLLNQHHWPNKYTHPYPNGCENVQSFYLFPPNTSQPSTASSSSQFSLFNQPGFLLKEEKKQNDERTKRSSNSIKLLSNAMAFNSLGINKETNHYEVIKISNIPWGISLNEIKCLLSNLMMPNQNQVVQAIHVMMNKSTGKTLSLAFVEVLSDKEETARTIRTLKRPPVKGRKLFFEQSSQHELMKELYPGWTTYFPSEGASVVSEDFQLQPGLIQRGEYESLLAVCRNFKLHFSRKCGERPFEHFISLLVKYPWDQPHIITTLQRDHLYEYYKQATAILRGHISKTHSTLDPTLLPRMIRGAIQSPGLTIPQKKGILTASASYCPSDLAHLLVQKPPETVSENEELLFVD